MILKVKRAILHVPIIKTQNQNPLDSFLFSKMIILDGIHDVKERMMLEVHPGSGVGALQATNLHRLQRATNPLVEH